MHCQVDSDSIRGQPASVVYQKLADFHRMAVAVRTTCLAIGLRTQMYWCNSALHATERISHKSSVVIDARAIKRSHYLRPIHLEIRQYRMEFQHLGI